MQDGQREPERRSSGWRWAGDQTSVALLTGLTAAPLITMPLVYLLRRSPAKLEPQAQAGRGLGYIGLRGSF